MTPPHSTTACPVCGAPAAGSFCSGCGASLAARACAVCRAELSPQARFCHRCGFAVFPKTAGRTASPHRSAWIAAGILSLLLVGGIAYQVSSAAPRSVPDMANAGALSARDQVLGVPDTTGRAGRAPDISGMTPRERFDRLFNRIMQAAERGDSLEVRRFTPMGLGAYDQLDRRDVDARYHAAVLHMGVGDLAPANALADTILQASPGHLFGYVIRGTIADLQNDGPARARAQREFLSHYDQEMRANRVEYLEHRPVLDEFRTEAARTAKTAR
jgi:hypothetical protein